MANTCRQSAHSVNSCAYSVGVTSHPGLHKLPGFKGIIKATEGGGMGNVGDKIA